MRLVKAELRKFFSTKTWLLLLLGTVLLSLVPVVITLSFAGRDAGNGQTPLPKITAPQIQELVLSGPSSATIFIAILGVIGITQEYRHRTATPTFLTTPARWKVIVAKLVTYLGLGVVYAAIAAVFVIAVSALWINGAGGSFTLAGNNWKILLGAAIAAALYGIVGVGFGALVRNQIGAVVGLLAYMFVIENILAGIPATRDIYRFLPGGASSALYTYTDRPGTVVHLLPPVQGGILLAAYGIVFAIIALFVSTRREVT